MTAFQDALAEYEFIGMIDGFVSNVTASGYQAATTLSRITIDKVELRLKGVTKGTYPCGGKRIGKNQILLNANITSEREVFFFDEVRLIASGNNDLVFSSIKASNNAIIDMVSPNKVGVVLNFNLSYQTIEKDFVFIAASADAGMIDVQEHSASSAAHQALFDKKFNQSEIVDSYNTDSQSPVSANAAHLLDRVISGMVSSIRGENVRTGTYTAGAEGHPIQANFVIRKFKNGLKQVQVTYRNVNPVQNNGNRITNHNIWDMHGGHCVSWDLPEPFQHIITRVRVYGKNLDLKQGRNTYMYGEFDEWHFTRMMHLENLGCIAIYFSRWSGSENEKMDLTLVAEGY